MTQATTWTFHLFGVSFATDAEAQQFAFEQWEPVPPDSATDAEYSAWEVRNPTWRLAEELEFYMDSDFVELAGDPEQVLAQIGSPSERERVRSTVTAFSHFILVGSNAIWGDRRSTSTQVGPLERLPQHTASMTYLGSFN
ncbi:hypothetical protein [Pseudomonas trivialis]|uniref:Uncharacterized protein n=1 Tax=Pseudomonas trivialis TaxID=200450 RepID=A0A0H5AJD7_9PSED|nr:hypothetical protein [Pseudomonas trivialis]AKS09790.1 hypothetical protein AA957_27960 [Pseudomonas trivialis]